MVCSSSSSSAIYIITIGSNMLQVHVIDVRLLKCTIVGLHTSYILLLVPVSGTSEYHAPPTAALLAVNVVLVK
jgi:hypothetical protein